MKLEEDVEKDGWVYLWLPSSFCNTLMLSAHATQKATIPAAIPFIEANIRDSKIQIREHNYWLYSQILTQLS